MSEGEDIAEAFAEALAEECGITLRDLDAEVRRDEARVSWKGVRLARAEVDGDEELDPTEVAALLLESMRDPRQDIVRAAMEVMETELPRITAAIRSSLHEAEVPAALAEELEVSFEDLGDLSRARHWTTDAELDRGWPELVLELRLAGEEVSLEVSPEQHPHSVDVPEAAARARDLAAAVQAPLLWPGEDREELARRLEDRLDALGAVDVHLDPDYPTAIHDQAFREEVETLAAEVMSDLRITERLEAFQLVVHRPDVEVSVGRAGPPP